MEHIQSESLNATDSDRSTLEQQSQLQRVLEEEIIFGRLVPGERLVEDALMSRFGVKRHVVRSVLFALERTGIVVRERNKGATVISLTPAQVRKVYDVREFLQRQAALLIPLPASQVLVSELNDIHAQYESAVNDGRFRDVHALNDAFHLTLFGGCQNEYLVESISRYMFLSLPVRAKMMTDIAALAVSIQHHAAMIRLLEGRDGWALAQLCVDHIQPAKRAYVRTLAENAEGETSVNSDRSDLSDNGKQ
jgi:DNA-binding GntR family transcriptional regulator